MPATLPAQAAEQLRTEAEDGSQARAVGKRRDDRLKPSLDAAVQVVVIQGLIVRLWRKP